MEWNPLKWLGKKTQEHKKPSGASVLEFPSAFDDEAVQEIQRLARSLSSPGVSESAKRTNQNDLKDFADKRGLSQAELMIYIYNASIDQEVVRRHGETGEKLINSLGALSEMNVYNAIKGKLPKWMEEHFPILSRIAAKSASVRALATGAVVFGGGVASAGIGIPVLGLAVATATSAVAGYDFARRLSRLSAKEKFEDYRKSLEIPALDDEDFNEILHKNELIENENGEAESARAMTARIAEKLIQGGHRFGEALGLTKDGSIDMDSQEARLLLAYEKVLALESDEEKMQKEIFSTTDPDTAVFGIARTDDAVEADFQRLLISKRTEGMQRVMNALRGDQKKEKRHGAIGALAGGVLGNVARAFGAVAWRGQTLQEFAQSHISIEANTKAIGGATKIAGDAITDVRLKMGTLNIPGGIKPEPLSVSGGRGGISSFRGIEATSIATVSSGSTETVSAVLPASAGAIYDAPAQSASAPTPGAPTSTEAISAEMPGMPKDWAMLKFLGQHLGEDVQKNLASARAGSFPASERGTLLNVLYNLKDKGLISIEDGRVTLKVDDAELSRLYQESHASTHTTADEYGKKIRLEHWKEWFGGEPKARAGDIAPEKTVARGMRTLGTGGSEEVYIEDSSKHRAAMRAGKVLTESAQNKMDDIILTDQEIDLDEELRKEIAKGLSPAELDSIARQNAGIVPDLSESQPYMRDDIGSPAYRELGARFGDAQDLAAAATQPASPSDAVVQPSAPSVAEVATVSQPVVSISPESDTGVIAEQHSASVSAKVEPPVPEKITGQTVAETPKVAPKLSAAELAQQAHQHMLDSLQKGKYAINPHAVEQIEGLRVSSFLERVAEVKAGKMDLRSAFASDQFSLKEYEKLVSYLTDHDPNAGEKRMLLKNYLLSKEK